MSSQRMALFHFLPEEFGLPLTASGGFVLKRLIASLTTCKLRAGPRTAIVPHPAALSSSSHMIQLLVTLTVLLSLLTRHTQASPLKVLPVMNAISNVPGYVLFSNYNDHVPTSSLPNPGSLPPMGFDLLGHTVRWARVQEPRTPATVKGCKDVGCAAIPGSRDVNLRCKVLDLRKFGKSDHEQFCMREY
ncbi:hypothetical protein Moror_16960 [Moniliophthora roreri MCA 2997]|uniref:Uncharacterized protein n=1 Tax=Moniliophthora roreri (strain MCA 2997) TaxID=1381753 RepID=V2WBM7_MONRO|nr:hypothetical protein Moror_16960 [Moniliophthora roreri MCA 2997]